MTHITVTIPTHMQYLLLPMHATFDLCNSISVYGVCVCTKMRLFFRQCSCVHLLLLPREHPETTLLRQRAGKHTLLQHSTLTYTHREEGESESNNILFQFTHRVMVKGVVYMYIITQCM